MVFIGKAPDVRTAQVQNANDLSARMDGNHDPRFGSDVAGNVSGKLVYVKDEQCSALRRSRTAYAAPHGYLDTGGTALEIYLFQPLSKKQIDSFLVETCRFLQYAVKIDFPLKALWQKDLG